MTWTTYRTRGEILRHVVETTDRRCDGHLPLDVDGVAEAFDGPTDLLGALQLRWHTRLSGRVERELGAQPLDLPDAVVRAWRATAEENPGVLAVLDHHAAHPADEAQARMLATAAGKGHVLLAVSAGLSSLPASAATVRAGEQLEQQARAGLVLTPRVPAPPVRLIDRLRGLRAALAA